MHPHTVLSRSPSLLLRHVINLLPLSHCSVRSGVKRQLRRAVHEPRRDSGNKKESESESEPEDEPMSAEVQANSADCAQFLSHA